LQYAVGDAPFQDVLAPNGQPVEYTRNPVPGHAQLLGPVTLPADASHQPYISLRWKYYFMAGSSGPRAQLRLDDILVRPALAPLPGAFAGVRLQNGQTLELQFSGSPHRPYGLEVSTDLVEWLPLGTVTMDINGNLNFIVSVDGSAPARFYRLRFP